VGGGSAEKKDGDLETKFSTWNNNEGGPGGLRVRQTSSERVVPGKLRTEGRGGWELFEGKGTTNAQNSPRNKINVAGEKKKKRRVSFQ